MIREYKYNALLNNTPISETFIVFGSLVLFYIILALVIYYASHKQTRKGNKNRKKRRVNVSLPKNKNKKL